MTRLLWCAALVAAGALALALWLGGALDAIEYELWPEQ